MTWPIRSARRALGGPSLPVARERVESLRQKINATELDAERLEQEMLEALAEDDPHIGAEAAEVASTARKSLAAYVRLTGAARTPAFSVSLLENLIKLSLPPSESDGDRVG